MDIKSRQNDNSKFWVGVFSFLAPVIGLIIYASTKDTYPDTAKTALLYAKYGIYFTVLFAIVAILLFLLIA